MVSWKILPHVNEVEMIFDEEDMTVLQYFAAKGYDEDIHKLPLHLKASEKVSKALPSIKMNTIKSKRKFQLSLPEVYYAVAIDGVLPAHVSQQESWKQFTSSNATFAKNFIIYQHFHRLGWIPRSGINYGGHYVLYRGSAAEFHSEYIVYVQDDGIAASWNQIQSLTRIAADVKKTVLLCSVNVVQATDDVLMDSALTCAVDPPAIGNIDLTFGTYIVHGFQYTVEAIAIRFWDALAANEQSSYMFLPQPVLSKNSKALKKKRIK